MIIALIAHDKMKDKIVEFAKKYEDVLAKHVLVATGTTGKRIMEATNLKIKCFRSGPLGGDQEVGAQIANQNVDLVLFFRDPLTAQPHEPDITALFRLSDVYEIPLATNPETAKLLMKAIDN